jgi:hypothetical protein
MEQSGLFADRGKIRRFHEIGINDGVPNYIHLASVLWENTRMPDMDSQLYEPPAVAGWRQQQKGEEVDFTRAPARFTAQAMKWVSWAQLGKSQHQLSETQMQEFAAVTDAHRAACARGEAVMRNEMALALGGSADADEPMVGGGTPRDEPLPPPVGAMEQYMRHRVQPGPRAGTLKGQVRRNNMQKQWAKLQSMEGDCSNTAEASAQTTALALGVIIHRNGEVLVKPSARHGWEWPAQQVEQTGTQGTNPWDGTVQNILSNLEFAAKDVSARTAVWSAGAVCTLPEGERVGLKVAVINSEKGWEPGRGWQWVSVAAIRQTTGFRLERTKSCTRAMLEVAEQKLTRWHALPEEEHRQMQVSYSYDKSME